MISIYDKVSARASKQTTLAYSTSFSMGIKVFHRRFHEPIYNVYGFVRLADEIVDTFHEFDKAAMMARFREDTEMAIRDGISVNPILHSFQRTVRAYSIEWELVDTFLKSMEMDLEERIYDVQTYKQYILGSAEVVGLMCLRVFLEGDEARYQELKPYAMSLGSAFQKVNFLRDIQADFMKLGRSYFPGVRPETFSMEEKLRIEQEIGEEFAYAATGIRRLPRAVRMGVHLAFAYYVALYRKIQRKSPGEIMSRRVRIPNPVKYLILLKSYFSRKI